MKSLLHGNRPPCGSVLDYVNIAETSCLVAHGYRTRIRKRIFQGQGELSLGGGERVNRPWICVFEVHPSPTPLLATVHPSMHLGGVDLKVRFWCPFTT